MPLKDYRRLTDKEQQITINRLAEKIHADKDELKTVLDHMNPVIELVEGRVKIFKNTLMRIHKNIKQNI